MISYALIGYPLGHTASPFIHRELFALSGREGDYAALEIPPQELPGRIEGLRALGGFNVTIPHKLAIQPLLDRLEESARLCGAVNTVKTDGGELVGYNTDMDGFLHAVPEALLTPGSRVTVLGAGGAATMFAHVLDRRGCRVTLAVARRTLEKAGRLAAGLEHPAQVVLLEQVRGGDLIINATPVGMYPGAEESPLPEGALQGCRAVFDAVYNPAETALLRQARAAGCRTYGGAAMLVWQAAAAHSIWYGAQFDPAEMQALIRRTEEYVGLHFGKGGNLHDRQ